MNIFCNSDQPSIELKFWIISGYFIKGFREGFYRDIFCIGFVLGAFKHKTIDLVPIKIQQKSEGYLIAFLCFFYLIVYFQCTGFEKRLVMKIFNCVKISTISITGNQYITSFSFNFPAENPRTIQVTK